MALRPKPASDCDPLARDLRAASAVSRVLFCRVIADVCMRLPALEETGARARINRLVDIGAWTEAAFALIESEAPTWKPRRLVFEDGEWLCSLSTQPNLPVDLDYPIEATHAVLPLAILCAFVEARGQHAARNEPRCSRTHGVGARLDRAVCCDNFI